MNFFQEGLKSRDEIRVSDSCHLNTSCSAVHSVSLVSRYPTRIHNTMRTRVNLYTRLYEAFFQKEHRKVSKCPSSKSLEFIIRVNTSRNTFFLIRLADSNTHFT